MCTLHVFIHTRITVPRNIQICITYPEATQWCQISQFQVSYHSSQIVFSCITDTIPTLSTNPNKAHLLRSLFVILLVLGYQHFLYLMNAFPAQLVNANKLLTGSLWCDDLRKRTSLFSTSPVYHRQTVFYTKSINRYAFYFLNAYLPCEATNLKTSIIFIPGTIDTRAPLIVLKTRTCVRTPETPFLAVHWWYYRRTNYAKRTLSYLGEVNLQHPISILVPSSMVP